MDGKKRVGITKASFQLLATSFQLVDRERGRREWFAGRWDWVGISRWTVNRSGPRKVRIPLTLIIRVDSVDVNIVVWLGWCRPKDLGFERETVTTAKINLCAAWTCALLMVMVSAAKAQEPAPCTTPVALGALSHGPFPKVGAPYSATVTTTHDQTLPDGGVIHGSVTTYQARDAAGREWQKRSLGCQPGPDGVRHPVIQMLVHDAAAGTTISWKEDDQAKVIHVVHDPPRVARPPLSTDEAAGRRALEEMGIHWEALGSKNMAGVMADGSRTVQTVPVQAGIDKPIRIVQETWVAKGLGLDMLSINDNSRNGRTTTEVVDLKLGEPDPALFAAPAEYKILDNNSTR
jgi:hypothetical protein